MRCVTTSRIASISLRRTPRILRLLTRLSWSTFFFDGARWHSSPLRHGEEVGWHELLFEALCHIVVADVQEYQSRHPGTSMSELPSPTVLVVMPLSRSAIPLCVLLQEACKEFQIPQGVVQVFLPLNIRGESVPIVHCVRHRRTWMPVPTCRNATKLEAGIH